MSPMTFCFLADLDLFARLDVALDRAQHHDFTRFNGGDNFSLWAQP